MLFKSPSNGGLTFGKGSALLLALAALAVEVRVNEVRGWVAEVGGIWNIGDHSRSIEGCNEYRSK